jgi:hypothetical protein
MLEGLPLNIQGKIQVEAESEAGRRTRKKRGLGNFTIDQALNSNAMAALATRLTGDARKRLYRTRYLGRSAESWHADRFCASEAVKLLAEDPSAWRGCLATLREIEAAGVHVEARGLSWDAVFLSSDDAEAAQEVAANPLQYPLNLVYAAQGRYSVAIATGLAPVGELARVGHWFALD